MNGLRHCISKQKKMNTKRLYFVWLLLRFLPETGFWNLKNSLYRWCGVKIGTHVRICSSVRIFGPGTLEIGDDVWIGHQVMLSTGCLIKIGSHVDIAPRVYMGTGTHEIDPTGSHSAGAGVQHVIRIGDGVWLCAASIILPGVEIGNKAVIAAGSVVNSPIEPMVIAGGAPCKKIKELA